MRVGLTGATGLAGHPIARGLVRGGHGVVTFGRRPSSIGLEHRDWSLGQAPNLAGIDAIVHAAFSHLPGKYRGGEGDDATGFLQLNRDGSLRLVEAAEGRAVIFLSSRAVYGDYPKGTPLSEEMTPRPDTLYGRMKAEVEAAVTATDGISLRATGIYGPPPPGRDHKWRDLFAAFEAGQHVAPRVGTELHGADLASAVRLILDRLPTGHHAYNLSDLVLDRRDLLAAYARITGIDAPLPDRADGSAVSEMNTDRIRALGWRPRGWSGIEDTLQRIAAAQASSSNISP